MLQLPWGAGFHASALRLSGGRLLWRQVFAVSPQHLKSVLTIGRFSIVLLLDTFP